MRAVLVTQLSGPLARYGQAGAAALRLWARREHVELEVHDGGRHVSEAMRAATATRPDLVIGPYGSGPAVAAARATPRLIWNHGGATTRLAHHHVVNVPAPGGDLFPRRA